MELSYFLSEEYQKKKQFDFEVLIIHMKMILEGIESLTKKERKMLIKGGVIKIPKRNFRPVIVQPKQSEEEMNI